MQTMNSSNRSILFGRDDAISTVLHKAAAVTLHNLKTIPFDFSAHLAPRITWVPKAVHWFVLALPLLVLIAIRKFFGPWLMILSIIAAMYRMYCTLLNDSFIAATNRNTSTTKVPTQTDQQDQQQKKRVAVIGAGPSGLVTTKELLAEGHEVSCYDADTEIGGAFTNNFWPGGYLTSSPYVTAYSDFEPPRATTKRSDTGDDGECWNHYSKEDYVDYLKAYANHFSVDGSLHMGKRILHVSRRRQDHHNDNDTHFFFLQVQDVRDGITSVEGPFDHVAICSGQNKNPRVDAGVPGFDTFPGKILHTSDFVSAPTLDEAFCDLSNKRILTIGLGESMADILGLICDKLQEPPTRVSASVRNGAFIIPRINPLNGLNNDFDSTRIRYALPKIVHNATIVVCTVLTNVFAPSTCPERKVRYDLFRQLRGHGPAYTTATKSARFVKAVANGKIDMKPGIASINGNKIQFVDGSCSEVDVLVSGCGYQGSTFPFLDCKSFQQDEQTKNKPSLCKCPSERYLRIFDPQLGSSIGFIGFARPLVGTIPTIAEVQARLFALVVSGKRVLPSRDKMLERVYEDREKNKREFGRHNSNWRALVNWIPYMDTIAEEIGCRPKSHWIVTKPRLALKLLAGPMAAFHYRLTGPGATPQYAHDVIRRLPYGARNVDTLFFLSLHLAMSLVLWPLIFLHPYHTICAQMV